MGDTIKVYSSNYDAKKLIMINPLYDNVEEYTDTSTNIVYPADVSRNYVNFTGDISNNDRLTVELSHYNENTLENYIAGAKRNYLDLSLNHDLHSLLLWGQYKLDNYPTVEYERDLEIPVITLIGDTEISLFVNDNYVEPGYSALDNIDGVITNKVVVTGSVNTSLEGIYDISYDVTDTLGNQAITVGRKVTVVPIPPVANPYFISENTITTNDDWPDGSGFEIAHSTAHNSTGWGAFRDPNPDTDPIKTENQWGWTAYSTNDDWVSITYPRQVVLNKYVFTARNNDLYAPRKWQIQGSNDSGEITNRTWTDIGPMMAPHYPWLTREVTEIDISFNKVAYSSFRVLCPMINNSLKSIGFIQFYTYEASSDSNEEEVVNIPDMSWVWPSESSIISELKDYHPSVGNGREYVGGDAGPSNKYYNIATAGDPGPDPNRVNSFHSYSSGGVDMNNADIYTDFIFTFSDANTWCSGYRQVGHDQWGTIGFTKDIDIYTSNNNFGPWELVTSDSHSNWHDGDNSINWDNDGTTTEWTPRAPSKYLLIRTKSNHSTNNNDKRITVRFLQVKVGVNSSN